MMVRASLTSAGLVALLVLGSGPVRLALDEPPAPTLDDVVLAGPPLRAVAPSPGLVDTASAVPGRDAARPVPRREVVPVEEALRLATEPGTVSVVGQPVRGERLAGVGVAVDDLDAEVLARIARTDDGEVLRRVVDPAGLALSFVVPQGDVTMLVDLLRQVRPDLEERPAASVPAPAGVGAVLDPESSLWREQVARAGTTILRSLQGRGRAVAPGLVGGMVSDIGDAARVTATGAAYAVAARAVPVGSRLVPVEVRGDLRAIAVRHPGGGGALLVHNPGRSTRVTLQVPLDEGRVARWAFRAAGGSLSALVI